MFQTFQTSIQEATLPDQPLAMPPPSPPVPSMTPPTPTNESPPPPDPPSAPSDIHESCVPLTIFKGLEADYQLHQVRFLLAFIMITIGTVALNYDWHIDETFTTVAFVTLNRKEYPQITISLI